MLGSKIILLLLRHRCRPRRPTLTSRRRRGDSIISRETRIISRRYKHPRLVDAEERTESSPSTEGYTALRLGCRSGSWESRNTWSNAEPTST